MILRIEQKGANKETHFWGCSEFPKFRAIEYNEENHNNDGAKIALAINVYKEQI